MRWLVLAALCACGGKLPETRYYQLAVQPSVQSAAAPSADTVIAVEPLAVDTAYEDERIVYRTTSYRLDYYNYHRWSAQPGALVAGYLEQALATSGRFRAVVRAPSDQAALVLGGRVIAIEEIDRSKTQWVGRIALELVLTDAKHGATLWTRRVEETEPLRVQTPEGLAEALSIAMARISAKIGPDLLAARPKK